MGDGRSHNAGNGGGVEAKDRSKMVLQKAGTFSQSICYFKVAKRSFLWLLWLVYGDINKA